MIERVQLWSCELGLFVWKVGWYYKLYQKILAVLYKRRVCFQKLHIIVQNVRYEKIISATKNKRLLNFWRKYITFKSKQWLNLRVKIPLSFSQILLLKKNPLRLLVESFTWIMSTANTEFATWRKNYHLQNVWDKL